MLRRNASAYKRRKREREKERERERKREKTEGSEGECQTIGRCRETRKNQQREGEWRA